MLGINLGKRRAASKDFCQKINEGLVDLAFVQEPNVAKFKHSTRVVGVGGGFHIINSDYDCIFRAILVASKSLEIVAVPAYSNPDCAVAVVNFCGRKVLVASVYCDIERDIQCEIGLFDKLIALAKSQANGKFIIHSNTNARSPM